jgi:hypothetical protein
LGHAKHAPPDDPLTGELIFVHGCASKPAARSPDFSARCVTRRRRPLWKKIHAPAKVRIGVEAHDLNPNRSMRSLAHGMSAVRGGREMAKRKLSPREIVQRLQMIEALAADGVPVAEAIRSAGMPQADYDRWRLEYNGLGRTLGPLLCATPKLLKTTRRPNRNHPGKPSR